LQGGIPIRILLMGCKHLISARLGVYYKLK
jgi:hypothetical protein